MIGIVPVPTCTPFEVVSKYPLKALDVSLINFGNKLIHLFSLDMELFLIVPLLPPIRAELDTINVLFNLTLLLLLHNFL